MTIIQPQALLEQSTEGPKVEDGQTTRVQNRLQWPYERHKSETVRSSKRRVRESNVDSGELCIQNTRLKYNEGGTGKIQMKHESKGILREI